MAVFFKQIVSFFASVALVVTNFFGINVSFSEKVEDFKVTSEQYYLHIDPAIEVLATTRFPVYNYYHSANKPIDMPVAWTKYWGLGRVFYCSLGHHDDEFDKFPTAEILMERGMLWAAQGKIYAEEHGLTTERFENKAKMY